MLGLLKTLKKSTLLLLPHFENENKYKNRFLITAYLLANLIQAAVVMFLFSYMSVFLGMFAMPAVTYQLFFKTMLDFTATLLIYGAGQASKYLATARLKMSLKDSMTDDLSTRWLNTQKHAYFGLHLEEEAVYPNKVLRDDIKELVDSSLEALDISLSTFFGFFIGIYRLLSMSAMLSFQFMGREIAVPGLMALGSMLYALGYDAISQYLSRPLAQTSQNRRNYEGRLQNIIHHIDNHAEAIALQKTGDNEKMYYQQGIEALNDVREKELKVSTSLKFIKKVHQYLSVAVGLIMAAPSIIAKKVQATDVLEINHYFSDIIAFFTATQENIKMVTKLNTSADRIHNFEIALQKWEALQKDHAEILYDQNTFEFRNFNVSVPMQGKLVSNANLQLPLNKIILLEGVTGTGKSTLIKAIAGIWPYSSGQCLLPVSKEETHIVPQKPCLPYESTLFGALTYQLTADQAARVNKKTLTEMMSKLGLQDKIPQLKINENHETIKNWTNELSGGELQRVALIGAILKKPKLLILDESLSALDARSKGNAITFIKKAAKENGTTVLMIDHQPQDAAGKSYYDAKVTLEKQNLVCFNPIHDRKRVSKRASQTREENCEAKETEKEILQRSSSRIKSLNLNKSRHM